MSALLVHKLSIDYWMSTRKTRTTLKGWIIGNSPCCNHRGHRPDIRSRGNLLFSNNGHMVFNCYNCGFKAGYYNNDINGNFENWLTYIGVPRNKIQEAKLEILSKKLSGELNNNTPYNIDYHRISNFKEVSLPKNSMPIEQWVAIENISNDLKICIDYLNSRGRAVANGWDYYWSPNTKWDLNRRIIIPFLYNDKIVGWSARYAGTTTKENTPRYFNSDIPNGYLFNCNVIDKKNRKYVLLTEGPLDAISIDAVSALGSTLNKTQIAWLNSSNKEVIVVPDRQKKNQDLIDIALENNWSVSFPDWATDIKDAADASKIYGKLYTLNSIIKSRTNSRLHIAIKRQMFGK